jgi:hypothetical protein
MVGVVWHPIFRATQDRRVGRSRGPAGRTNARPGTKRTHDRRPERARHAAMVAAPKARGIGTGPCLDAEARTRLSQEARHAPGRMKLRDETKPVAICDVFADFPEWLGSTGGSPERAVMPPRDAAPETGRMGGRIPREPRGTFLGSRTSRRCATPVASNRCHPEPRSWPLPRVPGHPNRSTRCPCHSLGATTRSNRFGVPWSSDPILSRCTITSAWSSGYWVAPWCGSTGESSLSIAGMNCLTGFGTLMPSGRSTIDSSDGHLGSLIPCYAE